MEAEVATLLRALCASVFFLFGMRTLGKRPQKTSFSLMVHAGRREAISGVPTRVQLINHEKRIGSP